jgi:hypothetical protein
MHITVNFALCINQRLTGPKFVNVCVKRSMRILHTLCLLLLSHITFAQSFHLGLFGGISNYQGDLIDKYYIGKLAKPAIGLTGMYDLSDRVSLRAGLTFAKIAGSDKYISKENLIARNLSFESRITEFSLLGEFNVFNLNSIRWSPYFFGGLAVFKFNPYTYDTSNTKYYLKPLSTEGQGLDQYPESKPYSLTQFAIPFGGGIKYAINDRFRIGLELGFRKTFTDYLDDVSTNYADAADLFAARGAKAVELAYRADELPGGNPTYPAKGAQRGGSKQQDLYYFTGFHLTYRLGAGEGFMGGGNKKGLGCPIVKP